MDRRIALAYGVTGQELELYRADWAEGPITGLMTASVVRGSDTNDATTIWTPAVTLDATAIAINAASGYSQANRKRLHLANVTNLQVGRLYYAENELGQREQVRVRAIGTGYVDVDFDLAYDYNAAGNATATLRGMRASATVDDTFVVTVGNINLPSNLARFTQYTDIDPAILELVDSTAPYRVLWSYTLAGLPRRHWTFFDLVRNVQQHGVVPQDLYDAYPGLKFSEPSGQRGNHAQRVIALAWEHLQRDLRQRKLDPASVSEGQMLDLLLIDGAMVLIANAGIWSPPGVDRMRFRSERWGAYMRNLEGLIKTASQSQNQDGSTTPSPAPPLSFRS